MKTPKAFTLVLTAALVAPAAPAVAQPHGERIRAVARVKIEYQGRRDRDQDREQQTERYTKTLQLGGNGTLDVSNIAGDIVVTRGAGNETTIEVLKSARGRTADEARQQLALVDVEVSERAGRGDVRTRYPGWREQNRRSEHERRMNVSVHYTISTPSGTRLTVKSVSGNIKVSDIKGELFLESVSGDVRIASAGRVGTAKSVSGDVEITGIDTDGALSASSVSGDVTLRDARARRLDVGSVSGNVRLDGVQCERAQAQSMSGDLEFSGPLRKGGRYDLQSHSGSVRMMVQGGTGFDLEATSFSGHVRSDLPLKTGGPEYDDRRTRRRSLRGVYGDGSAIVELTTFSGDIVIAPLGGKK